MKRIGQKPPVIFFFRGERAEFLYIALCLYNLLLQTDSSGSSVDPEDAGEPMETQGSAESSHADKESQKDIQESKGSIVPPPKRWRTFLRHLNTQASDKVLMFNIVFAFLVFLCPFFPIRPTSNQNIAAHDRLTIYFHAVLSKDFKFNPDQDRILIQAGRIIGSWEKIAVELSVSRYTNTPPHPDFSWQP